MHNNEKATECIGLEVKLKLKLSYFQTLDLQNELDRRFDH